MSASVPSEPPGVTPAWRSASEQVADEIRAHIQRAGLQPGDRVGREEDLAREFGVSRPTLREALRLLSSNHLIRAAKGPGGGIFVDATLEEGMARSLTDSVATMLLTHTIELEELLETRMLLEVPLVGLAAQRATEADVARLQEVLDAAAATHGAVATQALGELDEQLHRLIAKIAGNRLAGAFMEWVAEVLQPSLRDLIAPAVVDDVVVEQHRDIVRAIERGDPRAAERAMREHLTYLRDMVTAVKDLDRRG